MKKLFALLVLLCFGALASQALAQLMDENFDYAAGQLTASGGGANVSGGNWVGFSGSGFYIQVTSGSLTYSGYPSSGIGNRIGTTSTGSSAEDIYRGFQPQAVGKTVYASFLLNVRDTTGLAANTSTTGDYFFALLPSTSTSAYMDRLVIRKGASGYSFQLGLRVTGTNAGAVWSTVDRDTGATYLVVLKYQLIAGSSNDVGSLWINPALENGEPAPDVTQTSALASEPADLGRTAIRQGGVTTPSAWIDGIRVGTTWAGAIRNQPASSFSGKSLAFGNVTTGSTETDTVIVYNVGADTLDITGVTSSDAVFTVAPLSGTIIPLDSLKFAVTFAPIALGAQSSAIVFASNTTAGPDTVVATGTGVAARFIVEPTAVNFGTVFKDSTKTDSVTVSYASSSGSMVIDSVVSDNPVFTVTPSTATVPASDSTKFAVTFHPVAAGAQNGTIVFFHTAPTLHDTIRVSGNGLLHAPIFSSTPATLGFTGVLLGQSKLDSIVVRNTGYDSLFITSVARSDTQFTVTPTETRLDTGASSKFYVTYRPASTASVSAYLQFSDNTAKGLDSVRVTGSGGLTIISIAAARVDANQDLQPDLIGQTVTVVGIVNSVNIQTSNFGYFMQDTTGGIQVFQYGLAGAPALRPGYRIRVTGPIAYYRGTTEISPPNLATDIVILDTGNAVTAVPLTIGQFKANPEKYESMRIRLAVAEPRGFSSADWPAAGTSPNLNIWDGRDSLILRLDSDTEIPGSAYPVFPVALYGIASQFTSSASVYNDGYQITPMFNADFVPINAPPVATFHLLTPANGSRVYLDDTAQVVSFTWDPAIDFNGDTLAYTFAPVGFPTVSADGSGRNSSLSRTGRQMVTYLGSADSLALRWTVQASDGVNPAVATTDTFQVMIVRRNITGVGGGLGIPKVYALDQNFPNPFNPSTTIQYSLPRLSWVTIKVYSILGAEVATLMDEIQPAGYQSVVWHGTNQAGAQVSSGIYFYRISAQPAEKGALPFIQVKKMVLLK